MKNTFGNSLNLTIFGESHGEQIGAVLGGMGAGVDVDMDYINFELEKRRPCGKISTPRVEKDNLKFVSGVLNGKTTGAPICVLIDNNNVKSQDYLKQEFLIRPGHADYTAGLKYHGFQDVRGGGHFSGRITAPLVALGSICKRALEQKGVYIGSHIKNLHGVFDQDFGDFKQDVLCLNAKTFPTISFETQEKMKTEIENALSQKDSVGGVLETVVVGLCGGVGEPFFDSLESEISHAMFSIPAIKGIEFGMGFEVANNFGSQVNDEFILDNGKITTKTNNNGGINGGISNGREILFRLAVKPTPSIGKPQNTVDVTCLKEKTLEIGGRHDPAIIHRVRAVVDNLTAFVVADMLAVKFGSDYFAK